MNLKYLYVWIMVFFCFINLSYAVDCYDGFICSCGDNLISNKIFSYVENFDSCISNGMNIFKDNLILDCDNFHISGNIYETSGLNIIANNITIRNCQIENFYNGINILNSSNINIINSQISNNYAAAIHIENSNQVYIYENSITNNWDGIFIENSSDIKIVNNSITNNTIDGIQIYNNSELVTIKNNDLSFNDGHAIAPVSCNNYIEDLSNIGGVGKPIKVVSNTKNVLIEDVSSYSEIIFCNVQKSIIKNGELNNGDLKTDGILLVNSNDNLIENINFENVRAGIYFYNSKDNVVRDNNFKNNDYAIRLMQNSNQNVFEDNIIESSNNVLIKAENSYENNFYNIKIDKNSYDLTSSKDLEIISSGEDLKFLGNFQLKEKISKNLLYLGSFSILILFLVIWYFFIFRKKNLIQ